MDTLLLCDAHPEGECFSVLMVRLEVFGVLASSSSSIKHTYQVAQVVLVRLSPNLCRAGLGLGRQA